MSASLGHQDVLLRPLVTEKTLRRAERENAYTFEVHAGANKVQIRDAVERVFKVGVVEVRTQNRKGKQRRLGRWIGSTPPWKKAIVRVKAGDTIEFY
jgi:large subunit ribosomal protein L23